MGPLVGALAWLQGNDTYDMATVLCVVSGIFYLYQCFFNRPREIYVAELYFYPIKGCRGIKVSKCNLCPTGIKDDRRYMIVNEKGHYRTQRETPKLSLISPFLLDDGSLYLRADGMWDITCPKIFDGPKVTAFIWDDKVEGCVDQGDEVADWINDFLDTEGYRLIYMTHPSEVSREIPEKYADRSILGDGHLSASFADAFGYLMIGLESLTALNHQLVKNGHDILSMNRFRPNIVTVCGKPFEEDTFAVFKIGAYNFLGLKHCQRCVYTTTDQNTSEQAGINGEPLVTLRTFRTDPNMKNNVAFGENLQQIVPADKQGTDEFTGVLRVGDRIQVMTRKAGLAGF